MKLPIPIPVSAFVAGALVLAGLGVAGAAIVTDDTTDLPAAAAASSGADDSSSSSTVPGTAPAAGVDISGPCDEAEHAGDSRCTGTPIVDDGVTDDGAGSPATSGEVRSFAAGDAGGVSYTVDGSGFRLVAATPATGWAVEVEQGAGDELDLDFRRGSVRVQVDVEREDGQIRERVRVRDDATDDRTESEVFVGSPTPTAPAPTAAPAPAPTATDDNGGDIDRDDRVEAGDDRDDDSDRDDDRDDDRDATDDRDDDRSGSGSGSGSDDDRDDDDRSGSDRDDDD